MNLALRFQCSHCRFLVTLLILLTLGAQAQTTWTGTTSTDWAEAQNWNPAAVPTATDDVVIPAGPTNQPALSTAGAVAKTVEVQSGAKLTIAAAGVLTINGLRLIGGQVTGFFNAGTVDNSGQLALGTTASLGSDGLYNTGTFTNQAGGQLSIDRCTFRGLANMSSGVFTNGGRITLGANESVGGYGLHNQSTFTNQAGGQMAIDRASSYGLFNDSGGTFTNAGGITLGANNRVGVSGLQNNGTFTNNPSGQIAIDRTSSYGLANFSGPFTNSGRITIGAIASVGQFGLLNLNTFNNSGCAALVNIVADAVIVNGGGTLTNSGTLIENASGNSSISSNSGLVQNLGGGNFNIDTDTGTLTNIRGVLWKGCTSTDWATAQNWSTGTVPTVTDDVSITSFPANQPTLSSEGAVAKSVYLTSRAKLTIASGGSLTVNGFRSYSNITSGFYNGGTVENSGQLALGTTASLGFYGLVNDGTFTNQASGQVAIDRATSAGLIHTSGTFTNAGTLTIGANAGVGAWGINSSANFTNQAGGKIAIDRSTSVGLKQFQFTFTNEGTITIGANASVGSTALANDLGTFDNSGCAALLNIVADAPISNGSTFTNSGTILENATGNSSITSNSGIVVNRNGGAFSVGDGPNQPLSVISTNATGCSPPNGSIQFTGLKASTPYTLRYTLGGGSPTTLSPDSTSTASGTLTIPALGPGTYALTLSGSCVPLPIQLETSLTGPTPGIQGTPTLTGVPACVGQPVTVSFQADCGLFTAQLSDAAGSFTNPVSLGAVTSGGSVLLPVGTPTGSGYRIRLVSTSPALTSEATDAFRVTALAVAPSPTTPSSLCQGQPLPVSFSTSGNCAFPQGNVFTVQLSNASGSFINPLTLGTAQSGTTTIPASALAGLPAGTGYRVRIVSTNPAQTSQPSAPFELRYPSLSSLTPGVGGVPSGGICRGNPVTLSFSLPTGSCAFPGGNAFTAQLSSASGSFTNPLSLGPVQAGVSNSVTIPPGVAAGTGYRIRIVSSQPASTSLASSPFRVNATGCNARLNAEEPDLVVAPNPVRGSEIRLRVSGMDNPTFTLTTSMGRNVMMSVQPDGTGEFRLTPRQPLTSGVYAVVAEEGSVRLTRRLLVAD